MKLSTSAILGAAALFVPATVILAAELCVNPSDAECHTSIQAAVDAAEPGDTILISPHPDSKGYRENVLINTANLTLRGDADAPQGNALERSCPDVYLDGCETPDDPEGCGSNMIEVTAGDTSIERILLRHGRIVFSPGAEGSSLRESCVITTVNSAVQTSDDVDGLVLEHLQFHGTTGRPISILGNQTTFSHNLLFGTQNDARFRGDDLLIANNSFRACDDKCLDARGENVEVVHNLLIGGEVGIDVRGNNPTVSHNIVEQMNDEGIRVSCVEDCTGGTISNNRVIAGMDGDLLLARNRVNNFVIEDNYLALTAANGLRISGDNSTVRRNTIHNAAICMRIGGDDNLIEENEINLCNEFGIDVQLAERIEIIDNILNDTGEAGIKVRDNSIDHTIEGNQVSNGHGEGIVIQAEGTEVNNNVVSNHRVDLCADVTVASSSGNSFDTGGFDTPCLIN